MIGVYTNIDEITSEIYLITLSNKHFRSLSMSTTSLGEWLEFPLSMLTLGLENPTCIRCLEPVLFHKQNTLMKICKLTSQQ